MRGGAAPRACQHLLLFFLRHVGVSSAHVHLLGAGVRDGGRRKKRAHAGERGERKERRDASREESQ